MSKKKKKNKAKVRIPPVVTFRTVSIDFDARTVTLDGRIVGPVGQRGLDFPILSGDAMFMPTAEWDRVG